MIAGISLAGRNDDVDVDNRFSGQTGNRRAADVLDRRGNVRNRRPHARTNLIEGVGPGLIVVNDDEGAHVGLTELRPAVSISTPRRSEAAAAASNQIVKFIAEV